MPVVLVPAGLLLGGALLFLSTYIGVALIIGALLIGLFLLKKIASTFEALFAWRARKRAETTNLTVSDMRDLTVHAIKQYIADHPDAELRLESIPKGHQAMMYAGPIYHHYRDNPVLRSSRNVSSQEISLFGLVYIKHVTKSQRQVTAEAAVLVSYDNKIHFVVPSKERYLHVGSDVPDYRDYFSYSTFDPKTIAATMMKALSRSLEIELSIDAVAERKEQRNAASAKAEEAHAATRASDLEKLKSKL